MYTNGHLWTRFNKHRHPKTILPADLPCHIASMFDGLSRYQAQSKHFVSSAVLTLLANCYKNQPIEPALPRLRAQIKFDGASQGNPTLYSNYGCPNMFLVSP